MRLLGYSFALMFGLVILGFGSVEFHAVALGAEEKSGVYCEINGVSLFAQSAEDCEKAGGAVTHTVTTTVQPAGDNPDQEPEIQRTKDKEPEAP